MPDQQEQMANPFDKSLVLEIAISRLGVRRKVDSRRMRLEPDMDAPLTDVVSQPDMDAPLTDVVSQPDSEILHVAKDLIDCEEYDNILHLDNAMRIKLQKKALPSILRRGAYLIPVASVQVVDSIVEDYIETRGELVDIFMDKYPEARRQGLERQGDLADATEYPDPANVKAAFCVKRRYVSFSVPTALKGISTAMYNREAERLKRDAQTAAEEIRMALRQMFLDLVQHMHERLMPNPDGTRKVFRNSLIANFKEFLDSFDARNLTDDDSMAALVQQARDLLEGADAKALRNEDLTRNAVADGMQQLKSAVDAMLVNAPKRKFAWTGEADASEPGEVVT